MFPYEMDLAEMHITTVGADSISARFGTPRKILAKHNKKQAHERYYVRAPAL